ncbi:MAG: hypothetical protein HQ483_18375 [Rhodospirillales bacterium]|nr:hypothetical protein [Rhodospirillales bacterium]
MSNREFYQALGIKKGDPLTLMQIIQIAQMRTERENRRRLGSDKAVNQPGSLDQAIVRAVNSLDPANDHHWTAAGLPAMKPIAEIVGSATVRRVHIARLFPDLSRPSAEDKP